MLINHTIIYILFLFSHSFTVLPLCYNSWFTNWLKFVFNIVIILGGVSAILYNFCIKRVICKQICDRYVICKNKLPFTLFFALGTYIWKWARHEHINIGITIESIQFQYLKLISVWVVLFLFVLLSTHVTQKHIFLYYPWASSSMQALFMCDMAIRKTLHT
jgi:hypothetical protein